jgi:spermidine/putrescine transport system permease protein
MTEAAIEFPPAHRTGIRWRLHSLTPYGLLLPVLILIGVFFLVPLGLVAVYSFYTRTAGGSMEAVLTLENYVRAATRPLYVKVFIRTLRLAVVTTFISLILSYPFSYYLARLKSGRKGLLLLLVIFPFWTSIIVRSYAWLIILGGNGIINSTLEALGLPRTQLLWNETGVIIGLVHILLPYMILPLYASLEGIDISLEEAARTLGAGRWRTFWRITFPLSIPGAATGAILVFIITIGFYLTPALLGGPQQVVTPMLIYEQVAILNYPFAAALSMLLLIIVLILTGVFDRFIGIDRLGGIYG